MVAGSEDPLDGFTELFPQLGASLDRILFRSRQKTIGEAFWADIYDNAIGFVPVAGGIIGNGPRINDAVATKDTVAGLVHGADAALVELPSIGMIFDLIIPANTIVKAEEYTQCIQKGEEPLNCAFPKGTFERDLFDRMGIGI